MKTMKPLQTIPRFVFLLFLASSTSNASILEDACKSFAAGHTDIGFDYCIKFFQADQGSASADKRDLAVIAAKITGQVARNTAKRIAALKASENDKTKQGCLSMCAELYSDAADQLQEAVKGVASGNAGGLQDALTNLSAALDAPETCEDGFRELNEKSPLIAEDAEFSKEASIALAVTAALSSTTK